MEQVCGGRVAVKYVAWERFTTERAGLGWGDLRAGLGVGYRGGGVCGGLGVRSG
jgi:hypothetical protein